jgi:hypothetical protein
MKIDYKLMVLVVLMVLGVNANISMAGITNGTFDTNLNGWNPQWEVQQSAGMAQFYEANPAVTTSGESGGQISQTFDIGNNKYLSFDFWVTDANGQDDRQIDTDSFQAALFDVSGYLLGVTTPQAGNQNPYFLWWSDGTPDHETTGTMTGDPYDIGGASVVLNVGSLQGQTVTLQFNFLGCEDGYYSNVDLDNVALTVPVPGALFLVSLGIGAVGVLKRRKQL